ncbi:hypothetical protein I2I05_20500 [Hymenobacter sp. BT683]|uniref:Uncharacterized protein n=1 Tax=Hymenobacter jeongseonensis TaxID=2791027 RepID=A0ABS0IN86_9BACT|nr:hypothetical protein [Hymenobacter jeongseonensis]MBF9239786.1 hypothetical protein [Hymenobacter jeongseonensis]
MSIITHGVKVTLVLLGGPYFGGMNRALFHALSEEDQIAAVVAHGRYLARRWQEVDEAVHLYQMPSGFFAELTYNTTRNQILYAEHFGPEEAEKLTDYALFVHLPNWLLGTE